jgi:DNA mismatch repair protein MutS
MKSIDTKTEKSQSPTAKILSKFKAKYPDYILVFRIDDSYYSYYDDAKICSTVCDIALSSQDINGEEIPIICLPYYVINGYLKKLLRYGYKVAVFEGIKITAGVARNVVRLMNY